MNKQKLCKSPCIALHCIHGRFLTAGQGRGGRKGLGTVRLSACLSGCRRNHPSFTTSDITNIHYIQSFSLSPPPPKPIRQSTSTDHLIHQPPQRQPRRRPRNHRTKRHLADPPPQFLLHPHRLHAARPHEHGRPRPRRGARGRRRADAEYLHRAVGRDCGVVVAAREAERGEGEGEDGGGDGDPFWLGGGGGEEVRRWGQRGRGVWGCGVDRGETCVVEAFVDERGGGYGWEFGELVWR